MRYFLRGMIAAAWVAAMLVIPAGAAPQAQDSQAIITSPTDGQAVSGFVEIFGTATATDFSHYELAWGPDPNPGDTWDTFANPSVVLTNAQIGLWSTHNLPAGTYTLRLRVFRSDGSIAAEDFATGLIVGPPPPATPAATPTGAPPAPTFGPETQSTILPTIVIEQPPTATAPPPVAGVVEEPGAPSQGENSLGIDLSRFGAACVNGIWCAVGAYLLLGAYATARLGLRWMMKQIRNRSSER